MAGDRLHPHINTGKKGEIVNNLAAFWTIAFPSADTSLTVKYNIRNAAC